MHTLNLKTPPLESGDRLTREEFHARYERTPDIKAELIKGVVYLASPVSGSHSSPHYRICGITFPYVHLHTPGLEAEDNATLMLNDANEVQPDVFIYTRLDHGGKVKQTKNKFFDGTPELVIEIAASSVSIDLGDKKEIYEQNGVNEYIVWRVYDEQIDWFINRRGKFKPLKPDTEGITKSVIFPGLWLDLPAILRSDYKRIQEVLMRGVQSPEHAQFVKKLTKQKK